MDNIRQRFFFPDTDIRGEIIQLDSALDAILTARDYPMAIQSLLGESVVAAALMAATLKFDGRLSIQAQGQGDLNLLLAEATHDNTVRGLAKWQQDQASGDMPTLRELLGEQGGMAITLHPAKGKSYQSYVPLDADDLAGCLTGYFRQSEQLPTKLWLACANGRAAGILLQQLPQQTASQQHNNQQWQDLLMLADTITQDELLSLDAQTILHRLFHETPPQQIEPQAIEFACTCSREKVEATLRSLGQKELQALLEEQQGAEVVCDFCRQAHQFSADEVQVLVQQLADAAAE